MNSKHLPSPAGPSSSTMVGRFAPSPTGDLHFGSLLAAMASYSECRQHGGRWLLRIDDIDPPRAVPGSAGSITHALAEYGFEWHGSILLQSHHYDRYRNALDQLTRLGLVYACRCSRRMLPASGLYPGTCRNQALIPGQPLPENSAVRLRVHSPQRWADRIQGSQEYIPGVDFGDPVIWRRDGLVAYSLACAVDDGHDVSDVIRGADLLTSTPAQLAVIKALGLSPPRFAHIPVALDNNRDKLSKHSRAASIRSMNPLETLLRAWDFLGQAPVPAGSIKDFWSRAFDAWDITRIAPEPTRVQP